MKQKIISILLLLIATCSWGQVKNTSSSDEKQRIPIKPIVVEGEVTGVPDGTPVDICFRVRKTNLFRNPELKFLADNPSTKATMVDTIRNGKFHLEKKFVYKDFEDNEDNVEYYLVVNGNSLNIYATPGTNIKVTGQGQNCHDWHAESNNPLQKEYNEYATYISNKLIPINKKIQEAYDEDDVDDELIEKLQKEKRSIHVSSMIDFMKNKDFNTVFAEELRRISLMTNKLHDQQLSDRIRNLFTEKVPADYLDDSNINEAKGFLIPSSEHLHIGDKMKDFTLYDRENKEHKLSEYVGKKIVILQFSTKACGPCHAIRPTIENFYAKHKDEVEIITISCDDEKTWKTEQKVNWCDWNDHASGSTIRGKFDMLGYPYYVIIRPDGVISSTFPGNKELQDYFKTF